MSEASPKFTVVIPTYNRAELMMPTLRSVWEQKYSNFEIIVVDNCSTDSTAAVLTSLQADGKLKFLANERNMERAFSRNRGISCATGEFVTFLDSDDILYPDCLSNAASHLKRHPESAFFHCKAELLDENLCFFRALDYPDPSGSLAELARRNYIQNIGCFFQRKLLDRVTYDLDPKLVGVEDYDFLLRIAGYVERIDRIDKVNCGIQNHGNRSIFHEPYEIVESRMFYFIQRTLANKNFKSGKFSSHRDLFEAHQYLFLSTAAAIRGLTVTSLARWMKAVGKLPRLLFTKRAWIALAIILKYAKR